MAEALKFDDTGDVFVVGDRYASTRASAGALIKWLVKEYNTVAERSLQSDAILVERASDEREARKALSAYPAETTPEAVARVVAALDDAEYALMRIRRVLSRSDASIDTLVICIGNLLVDRRNFDWLRQKLAALLNSEQSRDIHTLLAQVEAVVAGRYAAADLRKSLVEAMDLPPAVTDPGLVNAVRKMRRTVVQDDAPPYSLGGAHLDPRTPPDWDC